MSAEKLIKVGHVAGVYGIKGWIKVHSYTDPRDNVVGFERWILDHAGERREMRVSEGRSDGKQVLAKIAGIDDRDLAADLIGAEILVPREDLPACKAGEYYWADLEGLEVRSTDGSVLGRIDHLIETGAHDVMVLDGAENRLIPFVLDDVVVNVDVEQGTVVVRWDASYWSE